LGTGAIGRPGSVGFVQASLPEDEEDPDRWGPPVGGRERGQDTLSGSGVLLGQAEMEAGLERFPEAFFLFSVFFSFYFYRFLNYSNLLQFRFKSNQNSNNPRNVLNQY
jgi:hypothetical protein